MTASGGGTTTMLDQNLPNWQALFRHDQHLPMFGMPSDGRSGRLFRSAC